MYDIWYMIYDIWYVWNRERGSWEREAFWGCAAGSRDDSRRPLWTAEPMRTCMLAYYMPRRESPTSAVPPNVVIIILYYYYDYCHASNILVSFAVRLGWGLGGGAGRQTVPMVPMVPGAVRVIIIITTITTTIIITTIITTIIITIRGLCNSNQAPGAAGELRGAKYLQ